MKNLISIATLLASATLGLGQLIEPVYDTSPHYLQIILNDNNALRKKYWVILDGEKTFVDLNANLNLSDEEEVI